MPLLTRPGSPTANAVIHREELQSGSPIRWRTGIWRQRVSYRNFDDADTSEVLDLNTAFPQNTFPTNVFLPQGPLAYFDLVQVFAASGLTDADFILGISGNTNGLIEAVAVETGQTLGIKCPGGDLYVVATQFQAAMAPLLQLDTSGANINTLTSGIVDVYIPYVYACERRTGTFI